MANFGDYETTGEIARVGLGVVYGARKSGGKGGAKFTVKVCHSESLALDSETMSSNVRAFMDRVDVQQRVAAAGSKYWAPVLDASCTNDNGYYVTEFFENSISKMVRGKVRLDAAALYHVVYSIVQGLVDLKETAGRAHGNLKDLGNILLGGTGSVHRRKVVMSDPAPTADLDEDSEAVDLRTLGGLIYQLVLHQSISSTGQAQMGEAWDRLGKFGEGWVLLTNELLQAGRGGSGRLSLDELPGRLKDLKSVQRSKGPWVGAAGLLIAAGVTAFFLFGGPPPPPPPPPPPKISPDVAKKSWDQLVKAIYGDDAWFGALEAQLFGKEVDDVVKEARARVMRNAHFRDNIIGPLEALRKQNLRVDPREIIGKPAANFRALIRHELEEDHFEKVVQAWEIVKGIRDQLKGEWDVVGDLENASKVFVMQRGWDNLGHMLGQLVGRIKNFESEGQAVNLMQNLAAGIRIHTQVNDVMNNVDFLDNRQKRFLETKDPVFVQFGMFRQSSLLDPAMEGEREFDIATAQRVLRVIDDEQKKFRTLTEEWAKFLKEKWGNVVSSEMAAPANKFVNPPSGMVADVKADDFTSRVAEAAQCVKVDSASVNLNRKNVEGRHKQAVDLMVKLREEKLEAAKLAAFEAKLKVFKGQMDVMGKRPVIERSHEMVGADYETLYREFSAFTAQLQEEQAKPTEWVADVRKEQTVVGGTVAVNAAWVRTRDGLLSQHTVQELEDAKVEKFIPLRRKVRALRKMLQGVDLAFGKGLTGTGPGGRAWTSKEQAVATAIREERIKTFLDGLSVETQLEKPESDWASLWKGTVEQYEASRKELGQMLGDFSMVAGMLDGGYLLSESNAAAGGRSVGGIAAQWTSSGLYGSSHVQGLIKPVVDRVGELRTVEGENDRAKLQQLVLAAGTDGVARRRSAYVRLGKLSSLWPASVAELNADGRLRKRMETFVAALGDKKTRAKVLTDEMAAEAHRRWEVCFAGVKDKSELAKLLGDRKSYGVVDAKLSEKNRVNLGLLALSKDVAGVKPSDEGKVDEATLQRHVAKLKGLVEGLSDDGVKTDAVIKGLLGQLETAATVNKDENQIDPNKSGPALGLINGITWRVKKSGPSGAYVDYETVLRGATYKLRFVRVKPSTGRPFYICSTEVGEAFFRDVVEVAKQWEVYRGRKDVAGRYRRRGANKEVYALMTSFDTRSADPRKGPRAWTWSSQRDGMQKTPSWLRKHSNFNNPNDLVFDPKHVKAGKATPINYISAEAAMYFSRQLGCRLPTGDEWKAAYAAMVKAGGLGTPNLRDPTFGKQLAHCKTKNPANALNPVEYPDADIFLPQSLFATAQGAAAQVDGNVKDDGVLWFDGIANGPANSSGTQIYHLVGNVSEYVYNNPKKFETEFKEGAKVTPTNMDAFFRVPANTRNLGVIGGSALSPPALKVDQVYPTNSVLAPLGNSDVGFRLAFTGGSLNMKDRIMVVLAEQNYLK